MITDILGVLMPIAILIALVAVTELKQRRQKLNGSEGSKPVLSAGQTAVVGGICIVGGLQQLIYLSTFKAESQLLPTWLTVASGGTGLILGTTLIVMALRERRQEDR